MRIYCRQSTPHDLARWLKIRAARENCEIRKVETDALERVCLALGATGHGCVASAREAIRKASSSRRTGPSQHERVTATVSGGSRSHDNGTVWNGFSSQANTLLEVLTHFSYVFKFNFPFLAPNRYARSAFPGKERKTAY